MKKIYLSLALVGAVYASNIDGYIRLGVQDHKVDGDKTYKQDSIGGKLSYTTDIKSGIKAKVSFYTTNKINNNDSEGMAFFDSNNKSYSILGEAFIKAEYKNSSIMIGQQELDTPFADTDDIGMIPNTFEAITLINKSIKDTTVALARVNRWAGVDAPTPQSFTKMQNDSGVTTFGVVYEGIKDTTFSGWYYDLKAKNSDDLQNISYIDVTYSGNIKDISYEIAGQYAKQSYKNSSDAKIVGVMASVSFENSGLTFIGAYNKSNDNTASNGFGGGPFFTSCEHTTIAEGGVDAKATDYAVEFDASKIGLDGVNLSYSHLEVKAKDGKKAKDSDYILSYDIKENLNLTAIYSDVDDAINGQKFKNCRMFVNYKF